MVELLTKKPANPFTKTDIYPAFAAFAAYYGEPREEQRWCALKKMADGESLKNLVDVNDRAFLFFLYVSFCAHLKHQEQRGWYFCPEATVMVRHVQAWMEEEDKDEDAHIGLPKKLSTVLEPLEEALDSALTAVNMKNDGSEDAGSDDNC